VAASDWYHRPTGASTAAVGRSSYTIAPAALTSNPQLVRDLARWYADVRGMVSSRARWQLVSSFNGWADGGAVEPASEWASPSGQGHYLDALRAGGAEPPPTSTVVAAVADMECSVAQHAQAEQQGRTDLCRSASTAAVARAMNPALVIAAGDLQYEQATLEDFQQAYDLSWGPLKSITRPALGNHEYCSYVCADPQAAVRAGYFTYFGSGAGTPGQGWYSYDVGGWHVIVLNSECGMAGGCEVNSPQERWLRADLTAHPTACTLAYWHRPLFSGGREGENPAMRTVWDDLYRAGVELVINGHEHQYERFAPQTPSRAADASGGILEFVAGTGGRSHLAPVAVRPNTAVQNADTFGVLRLDLRPLGFSWSFQPAAGSGTFTDSGSRNCH
jgi:acid phosphatase type 7